MDNRKLELAMDFLYNIPLGLIALLLISGKLEPNVDKKMSYQTGLG